MILFFIYLTFVCACVRACTCACIQRLSVSLSLVKYVVLLRKHHETNMLRFDTAETVIADQSQQESNKLREKLANVKGKKKRPEQRKENSGFLQIQVSNHFVLLEVQSRSSLTLICVVILQRSQDCLFYLVNGTS